MTMHSSSAPAREATPHATQTTEAGDIINALKQRALSVLNDLSIPPQNRAILRYALEINDPWFARMVRQMEADQAVSDELNASQTSDNSQDEPSENKIEVLVDLICRPGDEPETKSAALLVLMSALESSTEPTEIANTVKHLAFAHCGDLTFDEMVNAQIATFEAELFEGNTPNS